MSDIESRVAKLEAVVFKKTSSSNDRYPKGSPAGDKILDGQYGDPEIRVGKVRGWDGEVMVGRKMSECPPEFLDLFANQCEYFAKKSEEENEIVETPSGPKAKAESEWFRVSKARGWAKRLRSGEPAGFSTAATTKSLSSMTEEEGMPF